MDAVALARARQAAADPELARAVKSTMRSQLGPPMIPWSAAVEADRGRQMWSHGRRGARQTPRVDPAS